MGKFESQREKRYRLTFAPDEHSKKQVQQHSLVSFLYSHEGILHAWLPQMRPVKILIRLRCECAYGTHTYTKQMCYLCVQLYAYGTNVYVCVQLCERNVNALVCVQLDAYVTCAQSVKRSYDMYVPYTYVIHVHYMKKKSLFRKLLLWPICFLVCMFYLTHDSTYKTNVLASIYVEQGMICYEIGILMWVIRSPYKLQMTVNQYAYNPCSKKRYKQCSAYSIFISVTTLYIDKILLNAICIMPSSSKRHTDVLR